LQFEVAMWLVALENDVKEARNEKRNENRRGKKGEESEEVVINEGAKNMAQSRHSPSSTSSERLGNNNEPRVHHQKNICQDLATGIILQ